MQQATEEASSQHRCSHRAGSHLRERKKNMSEVPEQSTGLEDIAEHLTQELVWSGVGDFAALVRSGDKDAIQQCATLLPNLMDRARRETLIGYVLNYEAKTNQALAKIMKDWKPLKIPHFPRPMPKPDEKLRALKGVDFGTLEGSPVGGCGKITASDIDGSIEKNGCLLVIEVKCTATGETLKEAQARHLQAYAAKENTLVLAVEVTGERTAIGAVKFIPVEVEKYISDGKGGWMFSEPVPCNLEQFRTCRDNWLRAAIAKDAAAMTASF
jgi:hypothetical protein